MTDILCTICARGGSKGIPGKNIQPLGGKPLIAHSIDDALEWGRADDVVVSTDSDEIAAVAREYGASVPFSRPAGLATDEAPKLPVIQHALEQMEADRGRDYDIVVDLGVAAPLRNKADIQRTYELVEKPEVKNAYTVTESAKNPYFNMVELDQDGYARLSKDPSGAIERRQDAPTVYEMNASIYVYDRNFLVATESVHSDRTKISVMPPERSVEIDRPIDLQFARFLVENGGSDHA